MFYLSYFPELDPVSLKASRAVCHQWNNFILRRIWGAKRKVLEERLHDRWRKGESVKRLLDTSQEWQHKVTFINCDDSVIVVSRADHTARVYSSTDYHLMFVLDCSQD